MFSVPPLYLLHPVESPSETSPTTSHRPVKPGSREEYDAIDRAGASRAMTKASSIEQEVIASSYTYLGYRANDPLNGLAPLVRTAPSTAFRQEVARAKAAMDPVQRSSTLLDANACHFRVLRA